MVTIPYTTNITMKNQKMISKTLPSLLPTCSTRRTASFCRTSPAVASPESSRSSCCSAVKYGTCCFVELDFDRLAESRLREDRPRNVMAGQCHSCLRPLLSSYHPEYHTRSRTILYSFYDDHTIYSSIVPPTAGVKAYLIKTLSSM